MAALRFGPEDRDERGFVKPAEPRSLADLLPTPASIQASGTPAPQPVPRQQLLIGAVLIVVAIGLMIYLVDRAPEGAPIARTATPAAAGGAAPTPASAATAGAARLLVAFAAPDGAVLGAIESTRVMTPTAHYGNDWIQADVAGSGLVWLRSSDAPELAGIGPDLAPRPTVVRPAAPAAAPAAPQAAPPPPPPTEPPHCARVGVEGNMIERCGYADMAQLEAEAREAWIAQSGASPATVTTPTPYSYK